MGNDAVSNLALGAAGIEVKQQTVASITSATADGSNCVRGGQHVSEKNDNGNNHDYKLVEEVINDHNNHPAFAAVAGRLEQPANRR